MIKKVIHCMVCENRVADFFVEILIISLLRHWPAGCSGMGGNLCILKKLTVEIGGTVVEFGIG